MSWITPRTTLPETLLDVGALQPEVGSNKAKTSEDAGSENYAGGTSGMLCRSESDVEIPFFEEDLRGPTALHCQTTPKSRSTMWRK